MDRARLASLMGSDVAAARPLGGGCIAGVLAVDLADGRALVVKSGSRGDGLDLEGWMLGAGRVPSMLRMPLLAVGFAFSFPGFWTTIISGALAVMLIGWVWRENRANPLLN